MASRNKKAEYYRPAEQKLDSIWQYTYENHGHAAANEYITDLVDGIEKHRASGKRRAVPKTKTAEITDEEIYFFQWRQRPSTPPHMVFYRVFPDGNIGVIEITGPGQDTYNRLRDALEEVAPKEAAERHPAAQRGKRQRPEKPKAKTKKR